MKTHISLETSQLDRAVEFYEKFLGVEPDKRRADYALFLLEDPGLELAIDVRSNLATAHNAHYGLVVDSSEQVSTWIERLQAAGLSLDLERDVECCYAREDKAWATDPDGRRWEVYTVLEEIDERGGAPGASCC